MCGSERSVELLRIYLHLLLVVQVEGGVGDAFWMGNQNPSDVVRECEEIGNVVLLMQKDMHTRLICICGEQLCALPCSLILIGIGVSCSCSCLRYHSTSRTRMDS